MTPEEVILRKALVLQGGMSSADWSRVSAALRDRAFFSSRVAAANFLHECRTMIADLLAGARNPDGAFVSRAEVVSRIMRAARAEGIAGGTDRLADPGSAARANVIIDTNAGLAAGYVRAEVGNAYGARLAFPAQELVRVEARERPRDWRRRWVEAGGRLHAGRMVARKDDPVWVRLSRFGVPYPPFDFNSGMGVEDVPFDEAVSLGVITPAFRPPAASPLKGFNDALQSEVPESEWKSLKAAFGDQVRLVNGKAIWRHELIREAFESGKPFDMRLGTASGSLLSNLPHGVKPEDIAGKQLVVTERWLDAKRKDGSTHRAHFYPLEADDRNIPLEISDLELLPSIWRSPDTVEKVGRSRLLLSKEALDGGIYRAVVDISGAPRLVTFYRNKPRE